MDQQSEDRQELIARLKRTNAVLSVVAAMSVVALLLACLALLKGTVLPTSSLRTGSIETRSLRVADATGQILLNFGPAAGPRIAISDSAGKRLSLTAQNMTFAQGQRPPETTLDSTSLAFSNTEGKKRLSLGLDNGHGLVLFTDVTGQERVRIEDDTGSKVGLTVFGKGPVARLSMAIHGTVEEPIVSVMESNNTVHLLP